MSLKTTIQAALGSSTPSNSAPNGEPAPTPAKDGGAASRLMEKHSQVSGPGRGGARPGAGRKAGGHNKVVEAGPTAPAVPLVINYSPEVGGHVQKTIFGALAILGKSDRYYLDDTEVKYLAPLTSECLNQFAPAGGGKWVALSLLSVSMLSVFASKAQLHQADLKAAEVLRQAEARENAKTGAPAASVVAAPSAPAAGEAQVAPPAPAFAVSENPKIAKA